MNRLFILKLILISEALFLIGCKSVNPKSETFQSEIPEKFKRDFFVKSKKEVQRQFDLQSIENGVQDSSYRIWIGQSAYYGDTTVVVSIDKINGTWKSTIGIFDDGYFDSTGNVLVKKISRYSRDPIVGWDDFMKTFLKSGITELRHSEDRSGSITDGARIIVEHATAFRYKIVSYSNPEIYSDSIHEAKTILSIARFCQKQFNIQLPVVRSVP